MKEEIMVICLSSALLLSSCSSGEHKKPTPQPPVRVEAVAAADTEITSSKTYSGTVEESSGTALSFPVSGTLRTITVSEGDRVAKGQLVAMLDQSSLHNAYDIAKAALDDAQDAYNRMKMLHDSNSLPDMQWVEVQNALKQAQSGEAIAAKALKDAALYAPVSGYVTQRFAEPGMTVAPIEPIVKIVSINPVKVNVSIPEREISQISIGNDASIKVGAVDGAVYHGKVTERGVSANPLSRAYDVKIRLDNPDGVLLPGMICDVDFMNAQPRQAIVLPLDAVLLDADNANFVWIKHQGKAEKRVVTVDGIIDQGIVVSSGIAAGDSVIVSGQQKVSQGTPVVAI